MGVLRRVMLEKVGENTSLLAKSTPAQRENIIASAVRYEAAQREGDRGKLTLEEVMRLRCFVCQSVIQFRNQTGLHK
jgi:hypothetical protein